MSTVIKNVVTNVKVVGVGGAGCNIIMSMLKTILGEYAYNTDLIMMNTDCQSLNEPFNEENLKEHKNLTLKRIQLGNNGLGAGSDPEMGRIAAEYSKDEIKESLEGSDLIIICTGGGGGTGSGATPVVAKIAKELDILTIILITTPFEFEGISRMKTALKAVDNCKENADTTIVISNQLLFKVTNNFTVIREAFSIVDNMFIMFLNCLMTMLHHCGLINIDFSDIKTTIKNKGDGIIGVGFSDEEDAAIIATKKALDNPLSDNSCISSATNALVYISGNNMSLSDVETIMQLIRQSLGPDVYIIHGISIVDKMPSFRNTNDIFGSQPMDSMNNNPKWILVTLIVTGIIQNHTIKIKQPAGNLFSHQTNDNSTKTPEQEPLPIIEETTQQKSSLFQLLSNKFTSK